MRLTGLDPVARWVTVWVGDTDHTKTCMSSDPQTGWAEFVEVDDRGQILFDVGPWPGPGELVASAMERRPKTWETNIARIVLRLDAPAWAVRQFELYRTTTPAALVEVEAARAAGDPDAAQVTTATAPPKFPRAYALGQTIGVYAAVNMGLNKQPAPLAWAGAVVYVIKRRLARWLAQKAAPYKKP